MALLSGGDYHPVRLSISIILLLTLSQTGLANCGIAIAHGLARTRLGDSLLTATFTLSMEALNVFLKSWRTQLRTELSTNSHGYLSRKCQSLAEQVPESFPDLHHILLYAKPLTSWSEGAAGPDLSILKP
jgi:Holliday junction resolvase YEN1